MDPTAFSFTTGGGKGAQPNETNCADGTKVMRIDKVDKFVKELKDKEIIGMPKLYPKRCSI